MKKIPKSIKGKLKSMKGPILDEMKKEHEWQENLRTAMLKCSDEQEKASLRTCLDDSIKHWEVLKCSLEEYEKLSKSDWKVSPDTLLVVAGNLLGIVLILTYEKGNIITTKAINFILKGRV